MTLLLLLMLVWQQIAPAPVSATVQAEFNTVMMHSTFKIVGPSATTKGSASAGTGFLIGRPIPDTQRGAFVLVTAAHVLNGIAGDTATLVLRVKTPTAPYQRLEMPLQIRKGSQTLWAQHPSEDVAVMYVRLPQNAVVQLLADNTLATDSDYEKYGLHPGQEVVTIGYPDGLEANAYGFPILRSGRIASFPLTPATTLKTFWVDSVVFGGNSGGVVYVVIQNPVYDNSMHMGETLFRILGIVTTQGNTRSGERLSVAGVVHAHYIRETIGLLPPPK